MNSTLKDPANRSNIPAMIALPDHGRIRLGFRACTLAGNREAIEDVFRRSGVRNLHIGPCASAPGTCAYEVSFQPPSVDVATDAVQRLTDIGEVFFLE